MHSPDDISEFLVGIAKANCVTFPGESFSLKWLDTMCSSKSSIFEKPILHSEHLNKSLSDSNDSLSSLLESFEECWIKYVIYKAYY